MQSLDIRKNRILFSYYLNNMDYIIPRTSEHYKAMHECKPDYQ